jgi:hypothetical protein
MLRQMEAQMTDHEMEQATQHLPSKSAKIRTLDKLGVARADIARFLGIRYQHVRNVLVQPTPATEAATSYRAPARPRQAGSDGAPTALTIEQAKLGLAAHFGVEPSAIEITIRG